MTSTGAIPAASAYTYTPNTPYHDIPEGIDWFSPIINREIAATAARHGVSADDVILELEECIPSARTPRESIDRAAKQAADRTERK